MRAYVIGGPYDGIEQEPNDGREPCLVCGDRVFTITGDSPLAGLLYAHESQVVTEDAVVAGVCAGSRTRWVVPA